MQDFALVDNDLSVDNLGNFIFVVDAECVSQTISTAFKLFLGEYEYNLMIGISWIIAMSYGTLAIPLIQYQLQNTISTINTYISETELKIVKVVSFNSTFNETDRNFTINATFQLASGVLIEVTA